MQARLTLALALSVSLLAGCSGSSNSPRAVPVTPATNNNGTPVSGVLTASFDPSNGVIPTPNNLLLSGTTDLTLNIPVAGGEGSTNFGDPQVALNTLDGWSTTAPWSFAFLNPPNAATVAPGQSVRMFEVTLTGPGGGVTGIVRELAAGVDFVTAPQTSDSTGRSFAIVPIKPLKQLTSYMAIITNGVRDANGNDATPSQTYFLTKRTTPLCVGGVSQDPLLPASTACALEPLRQLTGSQLAAAAGAGVNRDSVVLSWVATTQSITPVLQATRSISQPGAVTVAPSGLTTAVAGLPPIADIFIGTLRVPYYLSAPSTANPTAPLNTFWRAAPGAYVAPFSGFGLNPTSRNITVANPIPVATGNETIPVLMTVPNAASGRTKPAAGWPVVIFQHGITRNRSDALAISATMAAQGFVVLAIDLPLHGLPPSDPLAIGNSPFGAVARERTFNVDYINNTTGAAGPDGVPDTSGAHMINLTSLLTSRDNIRQGVADLFVLTKTIPNIDLDANGAGDLDASRIAYVGQSLGSIVGTSFLALEPNVNVALLSVPGGGIARMLEASPTFGPRIRAGLQAAAGLQPGTPSYDQFFGATQQIIDSADPINYGFASATDAIVLHEVVGGGSVLPDQVIPNSVAGAPLSGTEPLIRALGLPALTASTTAANGVRGAARFIVGDHGSLLSPAASPAATAEMQGQMASLIASGGLQVQVTNTSVIRTQ